MSYISNQLDIFGLSFKSPLLEIFATIISDLFITGNPDDLYDDDPLDLAALAVGAPSEVAKIGTFLFAALGEWLFSSELPPIEAEVFETCLSTPTLPVCGLICNYCASVVEDVCVDNPFALDTTGGELTIPVLLGGPLSAALPPEIASLAGIIGDDRSINCIIASGWESVCSNANFCS